MYSRGATRLIARVAKPQSTLSLQSQACRTNCRRALSSTAARLQESSAATAATPSPARPATQAAPKPNDAPTVRSLTDGLADPLPEASDLDNSTDWTRSFAGLSSTAFTDEQSEVLQQELDPGDIEVKPDGIVYLPEIKYRRILNKAFKPGGWGLAPRGETIITQKLVTREYALVAGGRLISIARGEQSYFDPEGIPTATEGCKSNALMRCCKDLGIASELWDPRFIRDFLAKHAREALVEHQVTKKRRKHWLRKDDVIKYPLKEVSTGDIVRSTIPARK